MPQITIDVTFQQRSHRWVLEEGVFFDQLEYEQALAPIARQLDDWMERDEHGQAVVWDSEGRPSAVLDKYLGRLETEIHSSMWVDPDQAGETLNFWLGVARTEGLMAKYVLPRRELMLKAALERVDATLADQPSNQSRRARL